jgi:hypothetical protein
MSEKQAAFLQKLMAEKSFNIFELMAKYELMTGKRDRLPEDVNDFNSRQASWMIDQLLQCPRRLTSAEQADRQAKFDTGASKYEQLIAWAKEKGVPVRMKMKKATIMKMIADAGLQAPAEFI